MEGLIMDRDRLTLLERRQDELIEHRRVLVVEVEIQAHRLLGQISPSLAGKLADAEGRLAVLDAQLEDLEQQIQAERERLHR